MKATTWLQKKIEEFKNDFDYKLESLILDITEKISKRMSEKKINRSNLAALLGVSPPAVTKILNGNSNFTLKTLLSISDALDMNLTIDFEPREYSLFKKDSEGTVMVSYETVSAYSDIRPSQDDVPAPVLNANEPALIGSKFEGLLKAA